jgi:hypothetical protein
MSQSYLHMKIYYVYKHIIEETGEVFYVGRGKNNRAWEKGGRNEYWKRIVGKYGRIVEIIRENLELQESKNLEIEFIAQYKPRANFTIGGDGTNGYKFDLDFVKERNQKNKDLWKNEEWVKERNDSLTKAMNLPETKINISKGLEEYHTKRRAEGKPVPWTGRKPSEEEIKRISEAQKGEKGYWYGKTTAIAKSVINLDTGEIFSSIKTAAKSVNGNRISLSRALKLNRNTYKKNKFRYYEQK